MVRLTPGQFDFFSYLDKFIFDYDEHIPFRENIRNIHNSIENMMDDIHTIIGTDIPMISYYRTIWEAMIRIPEKRDLIKKYYASYMEIFNQWIEKGKRNGEVKKEINNKILAFHLASIIEGTLVLYSFQDSELDLKKMFDEIYNQLCDLLSP